jgi:hypothetical protein
MGEMTDVPIASRATLAAQQRLWQSLALSSPSLASAQRFSAHQWRKSGCFKVH